MNCGAREVKRNSLDVVNLPYVRNIFQNLPAYLAMDLWKKLMLYVQNKPKKYSYIYIWGGGIMSFCPLFFFRGEFHVQKHPKKQPTF